MVLIPKLKIEDFTHVLEIKDFNSNFPEKVRNVAIDKKLNRKNPLHVTIFGTFWGKEILEAVSKNKNKSDVIIFINELSSQINWELRLLDKYYFIEKIYPEYLDSEGNAELRSSIIQLVNLTGLAEFFNSFNSETGLNLTPLFPHVTLFTTSTVPEKVDRGIGIYEESDLESLKARLL